MAPTACGGLRAPWTAVGVGLLLCLCSRPCFAQEAAASASQLTLDQLSQLVAMELQNENRRLNETLFTFDEFQGVVDMDCQSRYVLLLKSSIALHDEMSALHGDILGLSGLYLQLLEQIPEENTWIWLLGSSHERIVQKMSTYWSRVVALALDQHGCLVKELREALLDGVVRWKALHGEFMEMHWNIFAFGRYMDTKSEDAPSTAQQLASTQRVPQGIEIGNAWTWSVREWFEDYANGLLKVLQGMEAGAK